MPRLSAIALAVPLAACAVPQGEFPSLSVRPIEGRSDAIAAPSARAAPDATASAQAARLREQVEGARGAFDAALPGARAAAERAGPAGGDRWIAAQLALTRLDQARARTVDALAALDRLLVAEYGADRAVAPETAALADTARDQAEAQAQAIAALKRRIAPAD